MQHDMSFNGELFSVNPWRGDCELNPVSPQYGSWEYGRNGWCPGAVAVGDKVDVTDAVNIGGENSFDFDILMAGGLEYQNTSPANLLPTTATSLKLYVYK